MEEMPGIPAAQEALGVAKQQLIRAANNLSSAQRLLASRGRNDKGSATIALRLRLAHKRLLELLEGLLQIQEVLVQVQKRVVK